MQLSYFSLPLLILSIRLPTTLATTPINNCNRNSNKMVEVDPSGINDGSGAACKTHDFSFIDENHLAEKRVASLTKILVDQYGVDNEALVKAICALGEGV